MISHPRYNIGSGIGRTNAAFERAWSEAILAAWADRCKKRVPGTHSLGAEFAIAKAAL